MTKKEKEILITTYSEVVEKMGFLGIFNAEYGDYKEEIEKETIKEEILAYIMNKMSIETEYIFRDSMKEGGEKAKKLLTSK